jgi:hypothetical protein
MFALAAPPEPGCCRPAMRTTGVGRSGVYSFRLRASPRGNAHRRPSAWVIRPAECAPMITPCGQA